jgi:isoleucyl-tRNA synthetase
MDKWILSNLNTLVDYVDKCLDTYKITESARAIQDFADILSNWYVRRGRERYWASDMNDDKIAAYTTLYTVLVTLAKITAPYTPFMAESIYQNLVVNFFKDAPESVHLCEFPVADMSMVDKNLEADMDFVLQAVVLGRSARNKANIKNRQPLGNLYILTDKKVNDKNILSLVADEINVNNCEIVSDKSKFMTYELKPQLKTLGPKYGKQLGAIRQFLTTCDNASEIVDCVNGGGVYKIDADGTSVELSLEDLLITPINKSGYALENDNSMTVVIDTNLTEELISAGIARELTSKIQTMRKEAGFEVVDHIKVAFEGNGKCAQVLKEDKSICEGVLCDQLVEGTMDGYKKELDVNGEIITVVVAKI